MSCHSLISSSRICPSFAYSCRCLYNVHFLEFWELIKPYDICPTFFIPHMSVATNRPPPQLTCSVRLIRAPLPRSYLSWPSLNSFATSISPITSTRYFNFNFFRFVFCLLTFVFWLLSFSCDSSTFWPSHHWKNVLAYDTLYNTPQVVGLAVRSQKNRTTHEEYSSKPCYTDCPNH